MLAAREKALLRALEEVKRRKAWGREEIRAFQLRTLQELATHAYHNSPFYRDKYAAAGFHPADLHRLGDLPRIPILTKDDLRRAGMDRLFPLGRPVPARLLATSGSTGIPMRMYRDEHSLWHFMAYDMLLYYEWCDRKPIESVLYFVDMEPDSIDHALADLLRTTVAEDRLVSVSEPPEVCLEKIREFMPEFISSYPSTMRMIAITMHHRGQVYDGLRLLHLTSEMLDERTRQLLGRVFPRARIIETYTSTEAGLIAYPCSCGRLHLAEDSAIVEIVDPAGNPTDGLGEIVVTDLGNWSTPILRYRGLGDFCRWADSACPCGSPLRSILHLEGRSAESILLTGGGMMSPYLLTNEMEEVRGIYQHQVIQHSALEFEVLVVKETSAAVSEDEIGAAVQRVFWNILRQEVCCRVRFVENILPRPGAHKVPLVVSKVRREM